MTLIFISKTLNSIQRLSSLFQYLSSLCNDSPLYSLDPHLYFNDSHFYFKDSHSHSKTLISISMTLISISKTLIPIQRLSSLFQRFSFLFQRLSFPFKDRHLYFNISHLSSISHRLVFMRTVLKALWVGRSAATPPRATRNQLWCMQRAHGKQRGFSPEATARHLCYGCVRETFFSDSSFFYFSPLFFGKGGCRI